MSEPVAIVEPVARLLMWLPGHPAPVVKQYDMLADYQKDADALLTGSGWVLVREGSWFEEHIRASAVIWFRMEVFGVHAG